MFVATGVGSGTGVASTVASINTTAVASIPIAAGGSFTIADTFTLTADIFAGTTTCLFFSANSPATAAVVGNITGGSASSGLSITGTGTMNVTGNAFGLNAGASGPAVNNASTGILNFTGNASGGSVTNTYGIANSSTGTVVMVGNGLPSGITNSSAAVANLAAGSFTLTGNATAGLSANGAANLGTGTFTLIGNVTASTSVVGFHSTNPNATNRISGSTFDSANGFAAIFAAKIFLNTAVTNGEIRRSLNGTSTFQSFYTADYSGFGQPATSNVRSGVTYAAGALTGTLAVPAAGSVALGVPVDATTGTAVLTAANVQTALTSQGLTAARASNLDNLDAAITSRMATFTYAEPDNASITAIKAKTDLLPASPASTGDIPTTTAVAAAVRTNLSAELARLDVNVSSAGDPSTTATAVWGKATSALTTSGSIGERLKNTSTVATTGEQLAAVLS